MERHQKQARKPADAVNIDHRAVGKSTRIELMRFHIDDMRREQNRREQQAVDIDNVKESHLIHLFTMISLFYHIPGRKTRRILSPV